MARHWLRGTTVLAVTAFASPALSQTEIVADPAFPCEGFCATYNEPQPPFKIFGGTYYVGTTRLSTLLITSDDGHILVDGGFPGAAPVIAENIRSLGFDPADIRLIVNSHTHIDHIGSIAAFQQATGAEVAASAAAADAMEAGHAMPNDPQYRDTPDPDFPPVANLRRVQDGEMLSVGDNTITAHFTPGHTPGGTSWTWQECEGETCYDIAYADSLNPISSDTFEYSANPDYLAAFRNSIQVVKDLPCDIAVVPHPELVGLLEKVAAGEPADADAFVDPGACAAYAEMFQALLEERLAQEAGN
jgi:metallo-beta-lactamase class B